MPVISDNFDGSLEPAKAIEPIQIANPAFRGTTVDTRYIPRQTLLTYVTGSKWLVNYYSQVVDQDSGLSAHQLSRPGHTQSYKLIKQFLLRVTQGLQASQDPVTKVMSITGTANTVVSGFIPNVGDCFLADVGDGYEGLFEISMTEKLSIYKDAVYSIEYVMVSHSSPELVADLASKTVDTVYYRGDYLLYGQKPMINTSEMGYLDFFSRQIKSLTTYYFARYFDDQFQTITMPEQTQSVYDPYLINALTQFFSTDDAKELSRIRVLNIGNIPRGDVYTVWNAVVEPNRANFRLMEKSIGPTSSGFFPATIQMNAIRFTGIKYVMFPLGAGAALDNTQHSDAISSTLTFASKSISNIEAINELRDEVFKDTPFALIDVVPPVFQDNAYLFSNAFYSGTDGVTLFEVCVRKHIREEPLDPAVLKLLVDSVYFWGELERFYFIPILIIMLKSYMVNVN